MSNPDATFVSLSPERRHLVRLMQSLNFGRIEGLVIRDREPVFDPPPKTTRELKFGGDNAPRPEATTPDFVLKTQLLELFDEFDAIGDGIVTRLDLRHGLPFHMCVPEVAA